MRQHAVQKAWATEYFHSPALNDVLYCNALPAPVRTGRLEFLLDMLTPATDIDRALIRAFFLTTSWGGPPGKRPLFVFSTRDPGGDRSAGRASGKSSIPHINGRIRGGYLSISRKQDRDRLFSDLLSPHGLGIRLVLLDNVKGLKFSSADIEAMITAPTIDGHVNYVGHGARPNYLTYAMTANEPMLSSDFASRSVPIELGPSNKSAAWDEQMDAMLSDRSFLDGLDSDIAWYLAQPTSGYVDDPAERWPLWWKYVGLPACGSVEMLVRVRNEVKNRRGDLDGDQASRDAIATAVRELLSKVGWSNTDQIVAFLPVPVLALFWPGSSAACFVPASPGNGWGPAPGISSAKEWAANGREARPRATGGSGAVQFVVGVGRRPARKRTAALGSRF